MAAGKQKNTPVIVMKKKRHIISPPPTEKLVITPPPPELPPGTVENEITAHQTKKKQKMDAGLTLPEWQGAARIITRRW
ncbi:hypothetical protein DQE51_23270, partial [Salmonella enterica subsp. enterica]|nr:hypothetical protein [Salmonella enterica subsp. enterica serovar Richmond]ECF2421860.1 hypothetical protein [Salmonella enterica subsp. enterica serovar Newport]MLO57929.1 hypothetical protein [Salmonella enterica subsp. enterica serovar Hvittingfoss]